VVRYIPSSKLTSHHCYHLSMTAGYRTDGQITDFRP
jgi:hypothetical protein